MSAIPQIDLQPCLTLWQSFVDEVNSRHLSVLEIGSRASVLGQPGKRDSFPEASEYVGFDYHAGQDVDLVGDAHQLSNILKGRRFDAIHSHAVLEHLALPWVAAVEMIKSLNLNGIMFHHVPFSWPIHELPWDFWRFTHQAYKVLFPTLMGVEIEGVGYDHPLHMHMVAPPPGQEKFHENLSYAFFGVKIRKVREADLSQFNWPLQTSQVIAGEYPAPR